MTSPVPCRFSAAFGMLLILFVQVFPAGAGERTATPQKIDFVRDIQPLLRRACVECHGPKRQEAGLRLDTRDAFQRGGDSGPVVVAGNAETSELISRVSLPRNTDGVMPAVGDPLTPHQINLLRAWINSGAEWPDSVASTAHWSYVPPVRPSLPPVSDTGWPRTPVDYFVLARLDREGLCPSPPAEAATLLRRVYLDLTGLPPSADQLDAFVHDSAPNAYERLVDRLLASPQFGVRWARPWLDYARYADSHGFQRDDFRDVWAYRDWVVGALNGDMPFDQFTTEQLAGDLLPAATESQKIASGFNRNAPTNVEAGSDPEETRVNQVFDRVNTLGMVWLGTTLECCQCHDHKYDPFTMREYYRLFAFFNNTAVEAERSNPKVPGSIRFLGPELTLRDERLEAKRAGLQHELAQINRRLADLESKTQQIDAEWEVDVLARAVLSPQEHVLAISEFDSLGGATHEILPDNSVLLSGEAPDRDTYTVTSKSSLTHVRAIRLEALTDPSLPGQGPGRGDAQRPNFVLTRFSLSAAPLSGGETKSIAFAGATADYSQPRLNVTGAIDNDPKTGWAINPKFHEPHWAVFELASPLGSGHEQVLTFVLEQNFGGSRTIGRLRLSAITGPVGGPSVPAEVIAALNTPADKRSKQQAQAIAQFRLKDNREYQRLTADKARVAAAFDQVKLPTTLVMQELEEPRPSAMFTRGDYRSPGERVEPGTPAVLHPLQPTVSGDTAARTGPSTHLTRLHLAHWLMSPQNPLTARVVVNRWWSEVFGQGLVTTPEDFGMKGEPPTHPELLDWLAVEYASSGWSLKHLLRQIVLSATYRQSSRVTPELHARDDQNLLYARGPRFRLEAEAIRDNALAIAGLLSLNQGGPPIRPYQPDGIWIKVGGERYEYVVSPGEQQYRRGLYVVWKRGAPYPSFINFDANNRLACRVRRPRSNTPLQALTLMNDPVYVEAAKAFAARILEETPGAAVTTRVSHAFRSALLREPKQEELQMLVELFEQQLEASRNSINAAKQFQGVSAPGLSAEEFAAWYAVAATLLNLDETITKG